MQAAVRTITSPECSDQPYNLPIDPIIYWTRVCGSAEDPDYLSM